MFSVLWPSDFVLFCIVFMSSEGGTCYLHFQPGCMLSDVCRFQVSEQGPSCRRFGARLDLRHMLSVGHSGNMLSFRWTLYLRANDGGAISRKLRSHEVVFLART